MSNDSNEQLCYNLGCGKKYNPQLNNSDSCEYHSGTPVFHDAYKGWSCCNKKTIDFTEFLNIKGCTKGAHSNVKPETPHKIVESSKDEIAQEVKEEIRPAISKEPVIRPSFDSPLSDLKIQISPPLARALENIQQNENGSRSQCLEIGTSCKNRGCSATYQGPLFDHDKCQHHPGNPVFHEGLKFWSCCQKRTSDFNAFLEQKGCEWGAHVWINSDNTNEDAMRCRVDWHQTNTHVIVTIYAKNCSPTTSFVRVNPIRLKIHLKSLVDANSEYNSDQELFGIIDVTASDVTMFASKLEIRLRKADACRWGDLELEREQTVVVDQIAAESLDVNDIPMDNINLDDL